MRDPHKEVSIGTISGGQRTRGIGQRGVYLGKLELLIDKLRVERSSLQAHKPIPASSASVVPPAGVPPAPSKILFWAAKSVDKKKLTVEQAAAYLGIAVQTAYQWCSERKIPYYKVRSKTFFDADELDAWRAKGKVKPISEVVKARRTTDSRSEERDHLRKP
jgi:excisionase family DNA binding protein